MHLLLLLWSQQVVQDIPAYAGFLCDDHDAAVLSEMIRANLYNIMRIIKEKLPVNPADHIELLYRILSW